MGLETHLFSRGWIQKMLGCCTVCIVPFFQYIEICSVGVSFFFFPYKKKKKLCKGFSLRLFISLEQEKRRYIIFWNSLLYLVWKEVNPPPIPWSMCLSSWVLLHVSGSRSLPLQKRGFDVGKEYFCKGRPWATHSPPPDNFILSPCSCGCELSSLALNYNMSSWVDDVGGVGVEGIRFLMLPSRRVTCGIEFLCSFKRVLTWFMTFIHLFLKVIHLNMDI